MRTELHASWVDGDAFANVWTPLPDATEFLLISCYVSAQGWSRLETFLRARARERSDFAARLVFSLSGLSEPDVETLISAMARLDSDLKGGRGIESYIMADETSGLFHPKAHGSLVGTRSRVVVGSANLTAGGMDRNFEMMTVLDDQPGCYQALRDAVHGLQATGRLRRIGAEDVGKVKKAVRDSRRRAHRSAQGSRKKEPRPPLGRAPSGPLLPPVDDADVALRGVQMLAEQGAFVVRSDKPDTLNVPVALDSFRKAGLLAQQSRQAINQALTVGQGARSINVALVPAEVAKTLEDYVGPLGRMVGRYSLPALGGRWMPRDWVPAFQRNWESHLRQFPLEGYEALIDAHLEALPKMLSGRGRISRQLAQALIVEKPRNWNMEAAYRLLGWPTDRKAPAILKENLTAEVMNAVLEHVRQTVGRRLSPAYVKAQLASLGLFPYLRPTGPDLGLKDALLFLADWVQGAAEPRLKSSNNELARAPNRSHVVQLLATRLRVDGASLAEVYDQATYWQRAVVDEREERPLDEILVEAWNSFRDWFGFDATTSPWETESPPMLRSTGDDDDDSDEGLDEEGAVAG